jgi:hypothetical protein
MTEVQDYFYKFEGEQREIFMFLHELLLDEFNLQAKIRYKIPFYFGKTWICYLNPLKKNGVEFAFVRANELSNEQGLLDFKDRKQVAGIELYTLADVPIDSIKEIINEAILLDEMVPYSIKKKNERS